MVNKICLLLILSLLSASRIKAQNGLMGKYILSQYTDENGLPQNSVKSIAADKEGFVWLATENGLVRFDGRNFYIFDRFNLPISDNRFFSILPSMEGVKGSAASKRLYAVADGNEFVRIENGRAIRDSVYYRKKILSIPFIKNGYQATYLAFGLPSFLPKVDNLTDHYIVPVIDREGAFYICDSNTVSYYEKWNKKTQVTFKSSFWNVFIHNGLLCQLNDNGVISAIDHSIVNSYLLSGDILKNPSYNGTKRGIEIFWNNSNDQVFLYLNKNLYILSPGSQGKMSTTLLLDNFDLASRNIQTIYYNRSDRHLFLGSITQGLFVLRGQTFETLTTVGSEMENVFYAQTPFGDNSVLTPRGIILGKNENTNGATEEHLPVFKNSEHIEDSRGILTDRNGAIWVKNGYILTQIDKTGRRKVAIWNLGDEIKQIYLGIDGMVWLGLKNTGLYFIDPNAIEPAPVRFANTKLNSISYILSKSAQSLLVGTEHGLYEVNLKTKKFWLVKGTREMFVKSVHFNAPDQTWITTKDEGLLLYSKNKLIRFPLDQNKYMAPSHCIVEDHNGFFWVTTNKGLFRMKKSDLVRYANLKLANQQFKAENEELFYQYYDKSDGLLINEFNGGCQPCAVRLASGYVSLPSLKGLVWFIPEKVKPASSGENVFLDKVEYGQEILSGDTDTLRLPSDPKRVRLYFSTPYFGQADNLHLFYALTEEDSGDGQPEWNAINSKDLSIYFSSLSSGNYTLLVKKINGFGENNYSVRKIYIKVTLHWYETWWAILFFILLFLVIVYGLSRVRLYRIEREKRNLEDRIKQRTAELEASRIEQGKQLQIMSRLLTSMSHDIQSPLNFIGRTALSVPKLIKMGEYEEVSEIVGLIKESSQNMSSLVADLLDYIKAYVFGKTMKFEAVRLFNLVDNKVLIFRGIIEANGNRINTNIPNALTVYTDYQMLSIILNNLIDNASKFTKNGLIEINAFEVEDKIHLVVSNNGHALSEDVLTMFNQPAKVFSINESSRSETGLGLFLVKEIAQLINVNLSVTQTETTNFELILDNAL